MVCNVNIGYEYLKYENSQNYAEKPQQNCMFNNSVSALLRWEAANLGWVGGGGGGGGREPGEDLRA